MMNKQKLLNMMAVAPLSVNPPKDSGSAVYLLLTLFVVGGIYAYASLALAKERHKEIEDAIRKKNEEQKQK